MKKFLNKLVDKKVFVTFYVLGIIYNMFVGHVISDNLYYTVRMTYFPIIYTVWAAVIVVCDIFRKRLFNTKYKIAWGVVFIAAALSVILQTKPKNFPQLQMLVSFGITTYMCVSVRSECTEEEFQKFFVRLCRHALACVVITNIVSIIIYILIRTGIMEDYYWLPIIIRENKHIGSVVEYRYSGLYGTIPYAGFCGYVAIILSFYLYDLKKLAKPMVITSILSCAVMIFLSQARLVFLICILIVLGFWFIYGRRFVSELAYRNISKILKYLIAAGIVLIICFCIYVIANINNEAVFKAINRYSSARLQFYRIGFEQFLQHKIHGLGWLDCDALIDYYKNTDKIPHYHSCIINMLVWTGLLGTVPFLYSLIISFKTFITNRAEIIARNAQWIVVLCLSVFAQSLLDVCFLGEDWHMETPFFWIGLGYLVYIRSGAAGQKKAVTEQTGSAD